MKRLNLAVLLGAVIIVFLLGYSQVRRHAILRECKALEAEGVRFTLPDHWIAAIWQPKPENVNVFLLPGQDVLSGQEDAKVRRIKDCLNRIGVDDFRFVGPMEEATP